MNIENEVFKRTNVNFKELEKYGFKKNKDNYVFEKQFLNNDFKAIITIDNKGIISGKVIDLQVDEEYTNIRTEMTGEFVNKVRESYRLVLEDKRKEHVENINANKEEYGNDICPKCGGKLVGRNGKYSNFIGCSNYPKCKYTRKK